MFAPVLHLFLFVLLAGPLGLSGCASVSPETRVGGAPGFSFVFASSPASQVTELHQENSGGGYHFASRVHTCLYCHDDPVNRIDSSGQESLLELDIVSAIQTTLQTIRAQGPRAALKATKAKIWDVYWGFVRGWPPDGAVFAANNLTPSGAGYVYDVNPINAGPQAMTSRTIYGNIRIRPTSLSAFDTPDKFKRKVATLNTLQYVAWRFEMKLIDAEESVRAGFTIPIDYSFYGAFLPEVGASNCPTWSLKAAGAAWFQVEFGN